MTIQSNSSHWVYHGSAELFDIAKPHQNRRIDARGDVEKIIWNAESFHATPHRWIALSYIKKKKIPETTGISLYRLEKIVTIYGTTTLEDALEKLYGSGGYLYVFDARDFKHSEGLGTLEVVSMIPVKPIRIERINDPIVEMRHEGVTFNFKSRDNL